MSIVRSLSVLSVRNAVSCLLMFVLFCRLNSGVDEVYCPIRLRTRCCWIMQAIIEKPASLELQDIKFQR